VQQASRFTRQTMVGSLILLAVAIGVASWYATRPDSPPPPDATQSPDSDPHTPDPRLVFDTPFRNVKPEVRYVGDSACARCHAAITRSYHAHPMGRSAELVSRAAPVEKYAPSAHTSFSAGPFDLRVEKTPEGARHRVRLREDTAVSVPEFVIPAEIAIGSGTRGRSYLTVEGGAVWQSPVSWFGPEQRWDLSPGVQLGGNARRPIRPTCLYCHVDRVEPIPGADNRYREPVFPGQVAIGCERCHGPGALHVAERAAASEPGAVDTSIVNPKHLSLALQSSICEQCHLQGAERVDRRGRDEYEFRPGLPFEQFVSVYVLHPDIAEPNRSVGQFEQMEKSRCFSSGRLVCTSCHDPHAAPKPEARDHHYRQRCLSCHESKGCSLPVPARQAKEDNCISCHMPRSASTNITHASVTNHRVPRTASPPPAPRGLAFGTSPLLQFRVGPLSPPPPERERDLGIALARFGTKTRTSEIVPLGVVRSLAITRLRASLARWPGDGESWGVLASTIADRRETAEKLKAATTAATLAPESEFALATLAEAARGAGQYDVALDAAGKVIRINPTSADALLGRAFVYLSIGDWAKAEADCRAALRLHPLNPEGHLYLAICLHHLGDTQGGQREAQTAAQLESTPREQESLLEWYRRATR
jgi:predicted CXXCH cytochrome family protein